MWTCERRTTASNPMDPVEEMVEDFFRSPALPATTHEEWLLRLCAQLMEREATAISVAEAAACAKPGRRR